MKNLGLARNCLKVGFAGHVDRLEENNPFLFDQKDEGESSNNIDFADNAIFVQRNTSVDNKENDHSNLSKNKDEEVSSRSLKAEAMSLIASHEYSSSSLGKKFTSNSLDPVMYFSGPRHDGDDCSSSGDQDILEYGCFAGSGAAHASLVLNEVLLPLLSQNSSLDSSLTNSSQATHAHKFTSSVFRAVQQREGGERMPIPNVRIGDISLAADDFELIQKLQEYANEWLSVLEQTLNKERDKRGRGSMPMAEVQFWRRRHNLASDLEGQFQGSIISKALEVLRTASVPIALHLDNGLLELSKIAVEAADNSKFLSTLERHFQTIAHAPVDVVKSSLPSLMDSLRMVWIVSRHYNRDERMSPLMERIAHHIAQRVVKYIDVKNIFEMTTEKSSYALFEAKQLLELWRKSYLDVRERIQKEGAGQRRWEFDKSRLFKTTDYMASVCQDLLDVTEIMAQFRRFLGPELIAVTGESKGFLTLKEHVDELPTLFTNLSFSIFSCSQKNNWVTAMDSFRAKVEAIEDEAGNFIKASFQKLRSSAEEAFSLVENFSSLRSRPSIHSKIEERYTDILGRYDSELLDISTIFEVNRDKAEGLCDQTFPPKSAAVAWALDLYHRAKTPILRFRAHDGLLEAGFGLTVKRRYLNFARAIDAYKEEVYKEWLEKDCIAAADGLKSTVISSVTHVSNPTTVENRSASSVVSVGGLKKEIPVPPFKSNFPLETLTCIAEAKHFDQMGFTIPQQILGIALQEETYHRYILELNKMVKSCNSIILSLSPIEKCVLKKQLNELLGVLRPGLLTLNWTSLRISFFIDSSNRAIEKFFLALSEVRKQSLAIENVVTKIRQSSLIHENDFQCNASISIPEFCEIVDSKCSERVENIVEQYRSIQPIMVKLEISICETDGAMSIIFSDYYRYWEKRVQNALIELTVRSAVTLSGIFRSVNLPPICRLRVNLTGKDLILVPSAADISKQMNCCIKKIFKASEYFVRWMSGSCLETQPQVITRSDRNEQEFIYSHFDEVSQNYVVMNALTRLNGDVKFLLHELDCTLVEWQNFEKRYRLWDPKRRSTMDNLIETQPPCFFFDGKMTEYEELSRGLCCEESICSYRPSLHSSVGFILVDFAQVSSGMSNQALRWKSDYAEVLQTIGKGRLDRCKEKIETFSTELDNEPQDLDGLKLMLNTIAQIHKSNLDMVFISINVKEIYEMLEKHDVTVAFQETTAVMDLADEWNSVYLASKTKNLRLVDVKQKFREVTKEQVARFGKEATSQQRRLQECGPGSSSLTLDAGLELLNSWLSKVDEMRRTKIDLSNSEELFGLNVSTYPEFNFIEEEINKLKAVYSLYRDFKVFENRQSGLSWNDLEIEGLQEGITELEKRCRKFEIGRSTYTFKAVEECISKFKASIPLIVSLKTDSMKYHHWEKLASLTGGLKIEQLSMLTLGDVFDMGLGNFSNEVTATVNSANQEAKIQASIQEIETHWKNTTLETKAITKENIVTGYILRSADDIKLQLEDHMLNIQTMSGSRFVGIFLDKVKEWEKTLFNISECMDIWYVVQRKWMYLDRVFSGAEDIRLQLPEEAAQFDGISQIFQEIMVATNDEPNIIKACCIEGRLAKFDALSEKLDRCQKSLSQYLNSKRDVFARFYFISDDELLSILGSSDPTNIQIHLLKLFDNVCRVGFKRGNKIISSMESSEGEMFDLKSQVTVEGPAEHWMTLIEEEMKHSLWIITKEAVYQYAHMERTNWIASEKTLGMNSICGSQIWWTWQVEDAFKNILHGNKHAMKTLESKLTAELNDMVSLVRSSLDPTTRKKVNTLLIIDVHARDMVSSFVRESIVSANQFEWESQLRFYWDRDEDDCIIQQCTGTFRYGYEYQGLSGRLVITPLTDRCYMTLTQALTFKLGGSPAGPAGTGKTETVKDLAKSLALPCFVINCGEGLDYKAMGCIFSGLVQCGAWGCFDEFNRINIEVLSVVSAQLKAIQNAISYDAPFVDVGTGSDISIKKVKGFVISGVFITMNPGYAGRTELPDNLKALFRPVTMVVPDLQKIAENMLFSEGFNDSKVLAKKMVVLYKLSKEQLSKQYHYDFGLRSMKTVLVMAGNLKRQYSDMPEDMVLLRILRDANMPKFVFEDVPLFMGLVNDLFPGMNCPRVGYEKLKMHISSDLEKNGFKCSNRKVHHDQIDKVLQMYETQLVRHTTMIVGPTGGGKSLVLKTLANAKLQAEGTATKTWIINPKAQSIDELYGVMDNVTRDWTDGVLSKIFRELNQPLPAGRNEMRWIIFDGDVDAIWVENMNSVMDDNRLLTLPNGERIRLQRHCAMICEVFDLQYASPATISRCGMVWVDPKNLGFRPFYERWVRNRYGDLLDVPPEYCGEADLLYSLFEKYAIPCIDFVLNGVIDGVVEGILTLIVPRGDIGMCEQLCCMLDSFLLEPSCEVSPRDVEGLYVYCVLWSIGAQITATSRPKFDSLLRKISHGILPDDDCLHNHFYSVEEQSWKSWESRVGEYKEPSPFCFHQIMVPTIASVVYTDMLTRMSSSRPLLFVGESGTSKTLTIENYLKSLTVEKYLKLRVNMSSQTRSKDVQINIEANVDKRMGNIYGPPSGKKLVIFFDDMNMPKVDLYGTQQPIALLLTLLSYGFVYDREKDLSQKTIKDVEYIAAMGPTGGGRNPVDPRFLSRFNIFYIPEPDEKALKSIYSKIIETRMVSFDKDVQESASKLTDATLRFFAIVKEKLPPTPSKFHYIFNLRDISRVYEGLCCANKDIFTNSNQLIRMWRHELNRIFFDRLVSSTDIDFLENCLAREISENFPECANYTLKNPLLFGNFNDSVGRLVNDADDERLYCDLGTYGCVKEIFSSVMKHHNTAHVSDKLELVLFENALNHLVRLMRTLQNPRGNVLLIGVGGSGKQSLSKLAAYACGYEMFTLTLKRGYCEADFREELKELYRKLMKGPVVFLFSDSNVVREEFLEYINNMLGTGIQPALFDGDEKEAICSGIRESATAAGVIDSSDGLWSFFVETCRNNLHIILSMSPSGEKLRLRCRNFPNLVSACMIDWFFPWPDEALEQLAMVYVGSEPFVTEQTSVSITAHMVLTHSCVVEKARTFREVMRRPYYVTPSNYLDFICNFKEQMRLSLDKVDKRIRRLDGGLSKLVEASDAVDRMQADLSEKKVIVDSKTKDVEALIEEIEEKTKVATTSNEEASAKQIAAEKQAKVIVEEKSKADSALMEALPAVEAAAEALNNIRREDLQELKAFNNPPIHVKIVCQMCTVLRPTGEKLDDSWGDSKKMLGNAKLLDLLKAYPKDCMTEKMYKSCKKILKENKDHDITVENMATKSQAGKGLLIWVFAILRYYEVAKNVEPLRNKVRDMEKAQAKTEAELSQLKQQLALLKAELEELQKGYNEATKELANLQDQASTMEKRLTAASKLIKGLSVEKKRWGHEILSLREGREKLIGDCLLSASFLSYVGAFSAEYRDKLMYDELLPDLKARNIPVSEDFQVEKMLITDSIAQSWNANGLPSDQFSIQNGILSTFGSRYPLCIDPQEQALGWIKTTFASKQLCVKTLNDSDFMKHLELAIQFGNPFLFENVGEDLDPMLDPILSKNIIIENGTKSIMLGDKKIDWDDNFRLFLCSKQSNPCYAPEVMGKVTLVNYCVTLDGLSDQLLNVVVSHERPDLEKQHKVLVEEMTANTELLVNLEDSLLKELSSSKGNILDNDDLIQTLEETKAKATEIQMKILECEETKSMINAARNEYKPVAKRGSILYFASSGLSQINAMYEISLDSFSTQFMNSLGKARHDENMKNRLKNLIASCTKCIYDFTCTGIFERHKLTFVFQLACMILEEAGVLDSKALNVFLKGSTSVEPVDEQKPESLDWMSESGWKDLLQMIKTDDTFMKVKQELLTSTDEFLSWYNLECPENTPLPGKCATGFTPMQNLWFIRFVRPDRCYNAVKLFVATTMGDYFVQPPVIDFNRIYQQSSPLVPLVIILSPGADPQSDIQKLGEKIGFKAAEKLHFISLGQGQGPLALRMLEHGYKHGHWVLLQNCHLLESWLRQLDNVLADMTQPHEDFRLWLTTEPTDKFPLGILQRSMKVVTEPPDGMKLNMRTTLSKLDQDMIDECDHPSYLPLVYVLTFLHAIVQERRKYGKIGWNVNYDFNESDFDISRKLISLYLNKANCGGKDESLPWGSIKYLVGDAMYGGRVSDDMDRRVLTTYVNEYIGDFLFDENYQFFFSRDGFDYTLPQYSAGETAIDIAKDYVESLPLTNSPSVFGLHPNAEIGYLMKRTTSMWANLIALQPRTSSADEGLSRDDHIAKIAADVLLKVPIINLDVGSFDLLDIRSKLIHRNSGKPPTPCQVVLLQELERWNKLCLLMASSLLSLQKALAGEIGTSDSLDAIGDALFNGFLPACWAKLAPATEKKLGSWMSHFTHRYDQYVRWIDEGEPKVMWLSGLHIPESYLTALVQTTCRRKGWPLDKSAIYTRVTKYMNLAEILEEEATHEDGCYVSGLYLEGAGWDIEKGQLKRQDPKVLVTELPILEIIPIESSKRIVHNTFRTPVYSTSERRNAAGVGLVFEADLSTVEHSSIWTLQGVSLVLNISD
uniref:AAA+ ATPase domain-containing protein n=1 Tax=Leptocylindrus danicus TaxID=163516 RepID=A0A7S2K9S5_9STRA|mmetsp:Transcript_19194/g.28595  ORF Transcript_19194/g.28595 Transcript_19194/m.28595 type:complete len:4576 (+) Transcript_19194:318-14045(+)|eukprot:CAMPEP_0116027396 /NCGR_PEP_ID=MMETSP0321-20121206/14615_1 /TAXON_ID=163516 /ORGANISM="Leptocylindrus danicus var. danicus, Strain B650" /LENGTH=4575 /DNA_ID=CAMNT_0003500765 /DNA_START=291 /DNA_END=14018 /DNA_ORIENTATION=+